MPCERLGRPSHGEIEDLPDGGNDERFVPVVVVAAPLQEPEHLLAHGGVVDPSVIGQYPEVGGFGRHSVLGVHPDQGVGLGALSELRGPATLDVAARLLDVLPVSRPHLGELDLPSGQAMDFGLHERRRGKRPAGPAEVLRDRREVPHRLEGVRAGRPFDSAGVEAHARAVLPLLFLLGLDLLQDLCGLLLRLLAQFPVPLDHLLEHRVALALDVGSVVSRGLLGRSRTGHESTRDDDDPNNNSSLHGILLPGAGCPPPS